MEIKIAGMSLKNIWLFLKDQMPLKRMFVNFIVTRNAWGAFHINAHISMGSGKPKVGYNTKDSAIKAANSMSKKHGKHFSNYFCPHCGKYHLGKNRQHKGS